MKIGKTIKNINRIRTIVQVLLKYGFEDVVTTTQLKRIIPSGKQLTWMRQEKSIFEFTRWERIRMVIEELGATYVKLAQILSNRPDVLPEELIVQFEKLQSDVPPFDAQTAKYILQKETGKKVEELFAYFDERPLGSASIGQVHRARLKTGEDVVVKIQRPDVKRMVETDLDLIKEFVKLTEGYFSKIGLLNPLDIVETFEKSMQKELDYRVEARNIEQFRNFYKKERNLFVPKVFKDLSSEKILIMELVNGCKITDIEQLEKWGLNPKKVAEKGIGLYLKQIFEFGYFHADPHPGNIIIRKDGTICLIDFGMVGRLMKKDKFAFAGIFLGMAQQDAKAMATNFRRLSIDSDIQDMRAFEYELNELIEDYAGMDVQELNMAELAAGLQKIIFDHKLKIPGSIFLILRALVILEGIGKKIHPGFKTFEFVKPLGESILKEQYSIKNIGMELYYSGSQFVSFLNSFPYEVRYILKKIRKGEFTINVQYHGFEPVIRKMDIVANRLTAALSLFALLISSSIIMTVDNDRLQLIFGIPWLSFIGFSLSAILGFWLIISVLRSGRD